MSSNTVTGVIVPIFAIGVTAKTAKMLLAEKKRKQRQKRKQRAMSDVRKITRERRVR